MAIKRDENGRFLPGTVGNPKGRPKSKIEAWKYEQPTPLELVDAMLPEIITILDALMHSEDENVAVQAARVLLDWRTQQDRNAAIIYKDF